MGRFLNRPQPRPHHHLLFLRRLFVSHLAVNELSLSDTRINTIREMCGLPEPAATARSMVESPARSYVSARQRGASQSPGNGDNGKKEETMSALYDAF